MLINEPKPRPGPYQIVYCLDTQSNLKTILLHAKNGRNAIAEAEPIINTLQLEVGGFAYVASPGKDSIWCCFRTQTHLHIFAPQIEDSDVRSIINN